MQADIILQEPTSPTMGAPPQGGRGGSAPLINNALQTKIKYTLADVFLIWQLGNTALIR